MLVPLKFLQILIYIININERENFKTPKETFIIISDYTMIQLNHN